MLIDAEFLIKKLNLQAHPYEGGNFKETYRSSVYVSYDKLSKNDNKDLYSTSRKEHPEGKLRPASTLIYYLLDKNQFSPLHRVRNDEIWHFYLGSPLIMYILSDKHLPTIVKLGNNIEDDDCSLHFVIRESSWFCAEVEDKKSFSLVGCTVSPGFDFADFELGKKSELLALYPQHETIINKFSA